jgi:hypothetical protein
VDSAGDEFFARAGLSSDQNSGIGGRDFGNPSKNAIQRLRGAHTLLKRRGPVHLIPQRQILPVELRGGSARIAAMLFDNV